MKRTAKCEVCNWKDEVKRKHMYGKESEER